MHPETHLTRRCLLLYLPPPACDGGDTLGGYGQPGAGHGPIGLFVWTSCQAARVIPSQIATQQILASMSCGESDRTSNSSVSSGLLPAYWRSQARYTWQVSSVRPLQGLKVPTRTRRLAV